MLDGAAKVTDAVALAAQDGMPAMGITDHGVMYGAIDFYKACHDVGIKPVVGCELYMAEDRRQHSQRRGRVDDDTGGTDESGQKVYYHLTALVRTLTGYRNMIKLSSEAFLSGFYYKPRADYSLLEQYHEGIIATTGCLGGMVLQSLLAGREQEALQRAGRLQEIFGKENLYVELQDHGLTDQRRTNPQLIQLARKIGAPLLATNDFHYTSRGDAEAHDALLCVQTNAKISDQKRFRFEGSEHYIKTAAEMRELFREIPEACDNTLLLAEAVDLQIPFGADAIPQPEVPEQFTGADYDERAAKYLRELTFEGARQRYGDQLSKEVLERLETELSVIENFKFCGYFLIVWDLLRFAKENGLSVGPGRGSAAGSCVAYCLRITEIDPLRYGLFFERFLNAGRKSMPDIDIDISDTDRDAMLRYASETYGEDHVAQIITFNRIKARAAVRDAARVLGFQYADGDRIAKSMPPLIMGRNTPIAACLEEKPGHEQGYAMAAGIRQIYEKEPDGKRILDVAKGLEGLARSDGIHAAAVVIAREPITEYVPVQRKASNSQEKIEGDDAPVVTQYEMHNITELGLLKMDFLGLRNLSVISQSLKMIEESTGQKIPWDSNLDLSDLPTFQLLQSGETVGVFQLEGDQMQALLRRMRPETFEDVSALIALYRPGPMAANMHNDYADCKNGRKEVEVIHEDMRELLSDSFGLCIYQEQMMMLAQHYAGYSLVEADTLRRACGKKTKKVMAAEREHFIKGCEEKGFGARTGNQLFDMIEPFSDYSFNKCVTGDTLVYLYDQHGDIITEPICETYQRLSAERRRNSARSAHLALSLWADGQVRPTPIRQVLFNGRAPVWEIHLADGKVITATANHRHMTDNGWRTVNDLAKGDSLLTYAEAGPSGSSPTSKPGEGGDTLLKSPPQQIGQVLPQRITEIRYAGEREVYDLEMSHHSHNWVGNGVVTHNSHAFSYGMITYQTAWLKANYPTQYMAALLTSVRDKQDKMATYLAESRRMGLRLLVPDINRSRSAFTPVTDNPDDRQILFGLSAIRDVGPNIVERILSERDSGGPFEDFYDMCLRLGPTVLNKRVLKAFIHAGTFDSMNYPRGGLFKVHEDIFQKAAAKRADSAAGVMSLFDQLDSDNDNNWKPQIPQEEYSRKQKLQLEKQSLGMYVSDHPLNEHMDALRGKITCPILQVSTPPDTTDAVATEGGQIPTSKQPTITLGGVVTGLSQKRTKRGDLMATFTLEDQEGAIDVIVFPRQLAEMGDWLKNEQIVLVTGREDKQENGGRSKLLSSNIVGIDLQERKAQLLIHLYQGPSPQLLQQIRTNLLQFPGAGTASIQVQGKEILMSTKTDICEPLVNSLNGLLGSQRGHAEIING